MVPLIMPMIATTSDLETFEAAAKCIAEQTRCSMTMAIMTSNYCHAKVFVAQQPKRCLDLACTYCAKPDNKEKNTCTSYAIRRWCTNPSPSPEPSASAQPSSDLSSPRRAIPTKTPSPAPVPTSDPVKLALYPDECLWTPVNAHQIVINLADVPPELPWERNGDGWVWKKNEPSGTDTPGSGEKCFDIKIRMSGSYLVTILSRAPHPTDHNDLWIMMKKGLSLYRASTDKFLKTTSGYVKGYQNAGRNREEKTLSTVDHNPHILVVDWMNEDEKHRICISGRSSKFTVDKIVLLNCYVKGDGCRRNGKPMQEAWKNLRDSVCR